MLPRPPVIAILGHVDHGKTTLLDYIRKSGIAAREHGGITQSIGAYEIATGIKGYPVDKITLIDTPGHEAFTKLRSRGAQVADIALLIIDAKDSLMPQTVESISHIKAAKIPYIAVANKADLPDAKPDKVQIDLLKHQVVVEQKGGDIPFIAISAKTGSGVQELLETILIIASGSNLTYDPDATATAFVIETKKDKRGCVVSAIIKDGRLAIGDHVWASDGKDAKIRSIMSDRGVQMKEVIPSTPFELLGFKELPEVGSKITSEPKELQKEEEVAAAPQQRFTIESVIGKPQEDKRLSVIIKTDTEGSHEAILESLSANENTSIALSAVGEITKSDIFLAKTTRSIVIGFRTKPAKEVIDLAKQEKVVIKVYDIIYELLDELMEVADLLKEREEREKNIKGEAKVAALFVIHDEKVCGVRMTKGKANVGDKIEVHRGDTLVGKSKLVSLRIRAKQVEDVKKDQEAGMVFEPRLDIKVSDMIRFLV